ncbi:MAG: B12-binding domain-containing radical SAM protein [Bacteroidetes bacterium]|nr:B12-binding domain-containing radical SAM protein [Bacteroidota bacterium]
MSNILLINSRPSRNYSKLVLDPRIDTYFRVLEKKGPKMGDTRTEPNNGLLILGNCLIAKGHSVKYLDINNIEFKNFQKSGKFFSKNEICELVKEHANENDFLFFSSIVTGIDETLKIIDFIKGVFPKKINILGGTFPSLEPGYCIKNSKGIDALVIGEGEEISNTLIEAYETGDFSIIKKASGVIFRERNNSEYTWLQGHNIVCLDRLGEIAFPAWELLDSNLAPHVYRVMASRGCGFTCSFCVPSHMSGHKVRNHSVDNIIKSIKRIKYEFKSENYVIGDLTFLYDEQFGKELLNRIIEENIKLPFWCQTHLSRITENNISLLKKAGCRQIAIGIESISPSVLDKINKGINEREIVEKLLLVKKYDIETQCYFIIGLPGDCADTVELNKMFIKYSIENNLIDRTHIGMYVPYPGTKIDSSIKIEEHDYAFYTQGVFKDIPSKAIASNDSLTSKEISEAFADCLAVAGKALLKTYSVNNVLSAESVIIGAEALSLTERIRSLADKSERKAVFNIVQGVNSLRKSFVSSNIFENENFVVGNSEVYNFAEVESILKVIVDRVDYILFDARIESTESEKIIDCAKKHISDEKVIWYSDTQTWLRTVQDMVLYLSKGNLYDKNVMLAPANKFTNRLKIHISDFCNTTHPAYQSGSEDCKTKFDFLVTYGELSQNEVERYMMCIKPGGYYIDANISSINEAVKKVAEVYNIKILRPDMRHHILSEILIGVKYKEFVSKSVGKTVMEGIKIVSGGHLGDKDDIIVDSVHEPKSILGIADGTGKTIPLNKLNSGHKIKFNKLKTILENRSHDN